MQYPRRFLVLDNSDIDDMLKIVCAERGLTLRDKTFSAARDMIEMQKLFRKPEIVSYIGYYRDHAIFELDNGLFARVDLRPENTEVSVIPYYEACCRTGNNPLQKALPKAEIDRLRRIYEDHDWC